ncbi:metal-dependent transcriptional regulator [Cyclobacterium jeungdonense]|uniref:Transcriptional regulator MntR n=1 Tax=Cyclobacterium jeungdonense TaxID=708087 RepID=A0ABT8C3L0_9BACT|nr:metal-dependent transcriptional regulator [Cyclobacterium jeungdonense]MDN3686677.1 metal-dependent transcriptional regulator [Cyclobacterium jeungdonense]
MNSQSIENYLKVIFNQAIVTDEVNTTGIAQALEVSLPSVNSMVKKLAGMGLLEYEKYRPLKITEKGRQMAAMIIRKHRLTEMYLVEKMGFGWEEVHDIAEQLEHVQSPVFFDRMDELLGYPQRDPHGSPIPNKNGHIATLEYRMLADCRPGEKVTLKALGHTSDAFLKYLNSKNLALGVEVEIIAMEVYDRNMTVVYDGHREVLSALVCSKLLVS